jgi:electron transport complex protein RnfE
MSASLGPFIPLIIVNCIIIGRAEACASKNGLMVSVIDALGMGAGFTITLCILAGIREVLATGMIFETIPVLNPVAAGGWFTPWLAMAFPVGAFVTLGLMLGGVNLISKNKA